MSVSPLLHRAKRTTTDKEPLYTDQKITQVLFPRKRVSTCVGKLILIFNHMVIQNIALVALISILEFFIFFIYYLNHIVKR